MNLDTYKRKTVAVFGLGISGKACAKQLVLSEAVVKAWDDSEHARISAFNENIPIVDLYKEDFHLVDVLVLTPNIGDDHPIGKKAIAAKCPVVSEVKLMWENQRDATYVGITGTNGKSTTATLIEHVLKTAGFACVAGANLGTPAVSLPDLGKGGVYVLEMSSYMLERVAGMRFDIGIFTNLTPDHLTRHKTMDGYFAVKAHLFDNMSKKNHAIICTDDFYGRKMAGLVKHATVVEVSGCNEMEKYPQLGGIHNLQNIACARSVASLFNVKADMVEEAFYTFQGLRHRQQIIRTVDNVTFVNDSKATNPASAYFALKRFEGCYLIAGGREKTDGYDILSPLACNVTKAFLIGEGASNIGEFLNKHSVPNVDCVTLDMALTRAFQEARQTDVRTFVILSPACSSYDQFDSFEQRGDVFEKLVNNL